MCARQRKRPAVAVLRFAAHDDDDEDALASELIDVEARWSAAAAPALLNIAGEIALRGLEGEGSFWRVGGF